MSEGAVAAAPVPVATVVTADEALALALLRGEPGAARDAEHRALGDTHPLASAVRLLLLAAEAGREAERTATDLKQTRAFRERWACQLGDGALRAVEVARGVEGVRVAVPEEVNPAGALC